MSDTPKRCTITPNCTGERDGSADDAWEWLCRAAEAEVMAWVRERTEQRFKGAALCRPAAEASGIELARRGQS